MKVEIKIPAGWRKLQGTEKIQDGDRVPDRESMKWDSLVGWGAFTASALKSPVIRKVKKKGVGRGA